MPTHTLRIRINGQDTFPASAGGDNQPWTTRVSRLKITGGGGGFFRNAQPWTCSLDLTIPPALAMHPRTITIGVEGPRTTPPAWGVDVGGGRAYRIVFHGTVATADTQLLDGRLRINAIDEMTTLFSRRARLAASANTGPRAVLAAIAAAHGLTINGNTGFPNVATGGGYQIDAPAQKDTPNGDYIRTALAGTGMSCGAEWGGTLGAPELWWRPDWFWGDPNIDVARRGVISIPKMWQLEYSDLGVAFDDFYAVVNVDGTDSGGTRRYGWARIHDANDRLTLGRRELQLAGWLDTTTQCRLAAKHLLSRVGYPIQLLPRIVKVNADHFADAGLAGVGNASYREQQAWAMATCMLGDQVMFETAALNPTTFVDPATAPGITPAAVDMLAIIRNAVIGENLWYSVNTNAYTVRTITREWDPAGGWQLELGLAPDHATGYIVDNADTDSGTY